MTFILNLLFDIIVDLINKFVCISIFIQIITFEQAIGLVLDLFQLFGSKSSALSLIN